MGTALLTKMNRARCRARYLPQTYCSILHRESVMKHLKLFSIGLIALLVSTISGPLSAQQTTKIQEAQILDLLKSMDSALLKKDAQAACTNFAEDATITIVLFEGAEKYTDTYDKKKYQ